MLKETDPALHGRKARSSLSQMMRKDTDGNIRLLWDPKLNRTAVKHKEGPGADAGWPSQLPGFLLQSIFLLPELRFSTLDLSRLSPYMSPLKWHPSFHQDPVVRLRSRSSEWHRYR